MVTKGAQLCGSPGGEFVVCSEEHTDAGYTSKIISNAPLRLLPVSHSDDSTPVNLRNLEGLKVSMIAWQSLLHSKRGHCWCATPPAEKSERVREESRDRRNGDLPERLGQDRPRIGHLLLLLDCHLVGGTAGPPPDRNHANREAGLAETLSPT